MSQQSEGKTQIVELPARWLLAGCVVAAVLVSVLGALRPLPVWLLGVEMLLTVLALFVVGSIRYRLDKNALTYGAALVVVATFW